MINFDLSLPDDDEWIEDEDDYKDREEYDRTMTPPSPSLLESEEDDEDKEFSKTLPPAKKRKQKNPFIDEEDDDQFVPSPVRRSVNSVVGQENKKIKLENEKPESVLDKLEKVDLRIRPSPEAVIEAQSLIIQYLKVSFLSIALILMLYIYTIYYFFT